MVILESHCTIVSSGGADETEEVKSFSVLQRQTRMHCQRSKPSTQLTGAATDAQNVHCRQSNNWWYWHCRVSVAVWTRLAKIHLKFFLFLQSRGKKSSPTQRHLQFKEDCSAKNISSEIHWTGWFLCKGNHQLQEINQEKPVTYNQRSLSNRCGTVVAPGAYARSNSMKRLRPWCPHTLGLDSSTVTLTIIPLGYRKCKLLTVHY